jgi:predicted Zn-dependent protease
MFPKLIPHTKLARAVIVTAVGVFAVTAVQAALFVSEKEIARQYRVQWLSMKKHVPIVADQHVQSYVTCVARRIINVLDEPYKELDWEVIVFDDDIQNAQVMPGGKIAVYAGILQVADTPDMLAAVIGHEAAHLTQEHVIERERRASRADSLVLLGGAATGLGSMVRDAATLGMVLPFNREQETEADAVGMRYMAKAGYDPRSAIYLWRSMNDLRKGRPPEFASSHPSPDTRMGDLVPHLTSSLAEYNAARDSGARPNCVL